MTIEGSTLLYLGYSFLSILGLVYLVIFLKDSTFTEDSKTGFGCFGGKEEPVRLSQKEKKQLYWPEEFKTDGQMDPK